MLHSTHSLPLHIENRFTHQRQSLRTKHNAHEFQAALTPGIRVVLTLQAFWYHRKTEDQNPSNFNDPNHCFATIWAIWRTSCVEYWRHIPLPSAFRFKRRQRISWQGSIPKPKACLSQTVSTGLWIGNLSKLLSEMSISQSFLQVLLMKAMFCGILECQPYESRAPLA